MKNVKKQKNDTFRLWVTDILIITFGSALYSISVNYFTAPNDIAMGGATGIATMINYLSGFPIGTAVFIINIPLFIIAFNFFGLKFIVKTFIATLISSVLLDLFSLFLPAYNGSDKLLAAIFGGVLCGLGLGFIFLRGATSGGTDILAKLVKRKYPHLSMGTTIFICDAVIVISTFFVYKNIESLMYSAIVFFVSSKSVDYIVFGASRSKMLLIITAKEKEVVSLIFKEVRHGATVIPAFGGYTGKSKSVLLSVVRPNEAAKITRIVKNYDPEAFTVISNASEVLGLGFKNIDQ